MPSFFPNTYINHRSIAVPVLVPDSIANCYINCTGVADFRGDPEWPERKQEVEFHLLFTDTSPWLIPGDVLDLKWIMVTVGLAHLDHDDEDSGGTDYWSVGLESADDVKVRKVVEDANNYHFELDVVVKGVFCGDTWIDTIAYEIDLLVYRPSFTREEPVHLPWQKTPWSELEKVARGGSSFRLP